MQKTKRLFVRFENKINLIGKINVIFPILKYVFLAEHRNGPVFENVSLAI